MTGKFTAKAQSVLNRALLNASEMGHTYIGSEHLLLGILSEADCVAAKLLTTRGIAYAEVELSVINASGIGSKSTVTPADMTPRTKHIIEIAAHESSKYSQSYIGTEHFLLAMIKDRQCMAAKILEDCKISIHELEEDIVTFLSSDISKSPGALVQIGSDGKKSKASARLKNSHNLMKFGRDLCQVAASGSIDPIIGRDAETERVIEILSRRTKNNPCLIGEPGVGKTAVVEGLAQRISDGNICDSLKDKIIVTLDIPAMLAGAKYRGEFEDRMKSVMEEIAALPSVILFIDEIHTIIGAGAAEGAIDAANILKPALARGELQVIGATTIAEYRKHIEKDSALERRFQSVTVGEPSQSEAIRVLQGLRDKYEAHHGLKISDSAIEAAVTLSVRYIPDRFLPDKAIDLIDEAASKVRIGFHTLPPEIGEIEKRISKAEQNKEEAIRSQNFEGAAKFRDEEKKLAKEFSELKFQWETVHSASDLVVGEDDVADVVTRWTGIPVSRLLEDENRKLIELEARLEERVIGQKSAVSALANAIRRGRLGIRNPKRPIGSFIFAGPTGVGKTELTRALSETLFGTENSLIRVDMSEYMEKSSVSKLIGSPPGYVGYEEGGQLTEKVRRSPYCVILFDEIEKAHEDVFNILLQILDDGILTDSQGRKVSFKNSVIIMTSNIGAPSASAKKALGFSDTDSNEISKDEHIEDERRTVEALKKFFRPEFINRVDEIIVFERLGRESIRKIAKLMLDEVACRISKLGIEVEFSDSALELISDTGFDSAYGARPLRRAIVRLIEDALSAGMLSGTIKSGDKVVAVAEDNSIIFTENTGCLI